MGGFSSAGDMRSSSANLAATGGSALSSSPSSLVEDLGGMTTNSLRKPGWDVVLTFNGGSVPLWVVSFSVESELLVAFEA